MLTSINIGKFLYLENIEIELSPHLNVFTGETGVGKSLVIDAIEFVLGKKGSFQEGDYVELVFEDIESEFAEDGVLILSRRIKNGKSQYFINAKRATLSTVKQASENIIEIHGQHSQQNLFSKEYQRKVLDNFANLNELLSRYQKVYQEYTLLKKQLEELKQKQSDRLKELDILKYQLQELEEADLKEGEKEALEERYEYLTSIKDIQTATQESMYRLFEKDESVEEEIAKTLSALERFTHLSPEIKEAYNNLEEAKALIKEAFYSLSSLDFDYDVDELTQIEEKLNLINHLEMKYNTDLSGLIALQQELKEKIEKLENLEFEIPELEKKVSNLEKEVNQLAEEISQKRKEGAKKLQKEVEKHLKELALESAVFLVNIEPVQLGKYGKDKVEFLFSANKGIKPTPIDETASGGELSRISLSLKLVSGLSADSIIFDEIDTGIGGKTAIYLAKKIKQLSKSLQVMLITHLPQVAVFADTHFLVEKSSKGEKTTATIKKLSDEEREKEIARMLSGIINEKSLEYARELIKSLNGA